MEFYLLVIVLIAIHGYCNAIKWDDEIMEVDVKGRWQMILDYDNHNSRPVTISRKLTRGFKSTHQTTNIVRAMHNVGTTIKPENLFKILNVVASINYGLTHTTETITMQSTETTNSEEITINVEVPARSRLVRWQLVADVGGYDIGFQKVIDSLNASFLPPSSEMTVKATLLMTQAITLCETPFRIKHKETGKYMTMTTRKNWPAATLGLANNYFFNICSFSLPEDPFIRFLHLYLFPEIPTWFTVSTLNTTYWGYTAMYSSDQGGIYFDEEPCRIENGTRLCSIEQKRLWQLSKSLPLHDNDVITFRNVNWPTAYLCHHRGPSTSVYCLYNQEDEWILEM